LPFHASQLAKTKIVGVIRAHLIKEMARVYVVVACGAGGVNDLFNFAGARVVP